MHLRGVGSLKKNSHCINYLLKKYFFWHLKTIKVAENLFIIWIEFIFISADQRINSIEPRLHRYVNTTIMNGKFRSQKIIATNIHQL